MNNWIEEDMSEAEKTGGKLPNENAPRLAKVVAPEKIKSKKPVLLKIDGDVHKQLSNLTSLRKIAGNDKAAVTNIFYEGLELYLKKHKLPPITELENGIEINESHIKN